jgi:hypothetical protein
MGEIVGMITSRDVKTWRKSREWWVVVDSAIQEVP